MSKFEIYNQDNIFAKIIRQEVVCNKILETEFSLSFFDINPRKKIHALVIPKGSYINLFDFHQRALNIEVLDFWQCVNRTLEMLKIEKTGFRVFINTNEDGSQEVPHLHIHILGGEKVDIEIK